MMKIFKLVVIIISAMFVLNGGGLALSSEDRSQSIIDALDSNKDGKVSLEEFLERYKKRAEKRFKKMDTNGDEFLTKEELENVKERKK